MICTNARLRRALWPPLLVGALGACGDASTSPVIPVATRLDLGRDTLTLFVPTNTTLTPVVLDQSGAPMAGAAVLLASRDTTTARVDAAGAVTGVAAGETWVVGTSGVAVDSARVTVRYHVLAGEARARVRGTDGRDWVRSWDPEGLRLDFLGSTERDRTVLIMANAAADTGVALVFPQAIQVGSVALERLEIQDLIEGGDVLEAERPVAYLVVETRDEVRLYTSLAGSFLQIERVTAAAGMGTEGHAEGRLVLRVQGWALRDGPGGEQTGVSLGDTLTVHADFSTDVLEWGVGQATVTLTGGPAPLADVTREAWWVQQDSGPGGVGAVEVEEGPPDIHVSLANPSVRSYALAPVNPAGGPAPIPSVSLFWWGETYTEGYSQSGTVTITEVLCPQGEVFGRLAGSVDAKVGYWQSSNGPMSSEGAVRISFVVPIAPEDAWAAPALLETSDDPAWRRLLRGTGAPH